jgi:aminoglycoside 3-N-acetyltransferase
MSRKLSKETLIQQIESLGVIKGDVVFLTADLLRIGYFRSNVEETLKDWVEILQAVIGIEGTLVIPAYTDTFFRFSSRKEVLFTRNAETTSGALSKAILKYGSPLRSAHPTNSCLAAGPQAQYILQGHDESASSYLPYARVMELGGKNLILGIDEINGTMAFHCVQEHLGHTRKHPYSGLYQSFYLDSEGNKKLFTRLDFGGCTSGVFKTYGSHITANAIRVGTVGRSVSACIDVKKSFNILKHILQNSPALIQCANPLCTSCRGRFVYNRWGVLLFWPKKFLHVLLKVVRRRLQSGEAA